MSEQSKRYRAFISYSQRDKAYARRMHQALENYRLPRGVEAANVDAKTRKLGRFFRDDDEMGAATDLGAALQGAIADAENLVIVCSPHAAQSRWVNEEIIHFKRTNRSDRIFAIIVGGEPNAPAGRQERECFPPALRFELSPDGGLSDKPTEALGLDVRKESLHRITARLAAGLLRTPFDALWKREQRRARARAAVVSLLASLVVLTVGGAVTQNLWRPRLDTYLLYTRFVHTTAELMATRPGTTFQDCQQGTTYCPVMVVIPEGRFRMGSAPDDPEAQDSELPTREISIARFAASQYEITFADWRRCFDAGGCGNAMPDNSDWEGDNRPVINVSWEDAEQYVAWLSRMTGHQYRLLSEAEWEYAARARVSADAPHTRFSWGDSEPACVENQPNGAAHGAAYSDLLVGCGVENYGPWPVGSFSEARNAFGLYDVHGNVDEWVEDYYAAYDPAQLDGAAVGREAAAASVANGTPADREFAGYAVIRGGSWTDDPQALRSASRYMMYPNYRGVSTGFRVARTL